MRTGVVQRADVGQHERGLDEENDAESNGNQPCTGEPSLPLLTRVRIHSAELPVLDIDRRRPDGLKLTPSQVDAERPGLDLPGSPRDPP
jgi:hypothetical protein